MTGIDQEYADGLFLTNDNAAIVALVNAMRFKPGDAVRKFTGDYGGPGEVIGTVEFDGKTRYVVAFKIEGGFGRFLHLLSEHQLRHRLRPLGGQHATEEIGAKAEANESTQLRTTITEDGRQGSAIAPPAQREDHAAARQGEARMTAGRPTVLDQLNAARTALDAVRAQVALKVFTDSREPWEELLNKVEVEIEGAERTLRDAVCDANAIIDRLM